MIATMTWTPSISFSKLSLSVALVPALERMLSTSSHTLIPGQREESCDLIVRAWSCPLAQLWLKKVWNWPASRTGGKTSVSSSAHRKMSLAGTKSSMRWRVNMRANPPRREVSMIAERKEGETVNRRDAHSPDSCSLTASNSSVSSFMRKMAALMKKAQSEQFERVASKLSARLLYGCTCIWMTVKRRATKRPMMSCEKEPGLKGLSTRKPTRMSFCATHTSSHQ
mmetsp:Transcript_4268/g.9236  ORF Transcript_4268/g.9236 Transcript_4268/m.9236 type:complete len:225 (-) Transcript_4268:324-998(-)